MSFFGRFAAALACAVATAMPAHGSTPEIDRGMAWLASRVQADGQLLDEAASIGTSLQVRSEAALTLKQLGTLPAALADILAADAADDTESLARRVLALRAAGRDAATAVALLKARQNGDGGFAPLPEHDSTLIDTAFALEALAGEVDTGGMASQALGYLFSRQAADGRFPQSSAVSEEYATALLMHAVWRYRFAFAVSEPLSRARTWLLGTRAAGLWSSTDLGAQALIAILPTLVTRDAVADSLAALIAAQAPDGSWGGDAYVTALALRALAASLAPATNPDLGSMSGRIVNGGNSLPLADATVAITGKESHSLVTDATGTFSFDKLPAGSYEFTVTRSGFGGIRGTLALQPGQNAALGDIVLLAVVTPTTATVRGVVTDAVTGTPINGASITAGNRTGTTNATGAYEVVNITPGEITIRVTAGGYFASLASAAVAAGQTLIFSPALTRTTASTTTIRGRVTNKATDAPIASATVRLTGANTATVTTNNAGDYSVANLAPGPTTVEVTRTGFSRALVTLDVELNNSYDFSPRLEAVPAGGTLAPRLSGRIVDALTGAPIPGTVGLSGANTATVRADGTGFYQFEGLAAGVTIVAFSQPGYQPTARPITLAASTAHELRAELYPDGYLDPNGSISGRAVDEVNLAPVAGAVVSAELDADTRLFTVAGSDGRFTLPGGLEGRWKIAIGRSGYVDYATEVLIPPGGKSNLGDVRLKRQADVARQPDLVVSLIDRRRLPSDPLDYKAIGQVDVQVSNIGNAPTAQGFRVAIYIDVDRDGRFDPAKDQVIGSARFTGTIDSRGFATVTLDVNGVLPFRDAPFRVRVDADEEIVELNEINNEASSADLGVCL